MSRIFSININKYLNTLKHAIHKELKEFIFLQMPAIKSSKKQSKKIIFFAVP